MGDSALDELEELSLEEATMLSEIQSAMDCFSDFQCRFRLNRLQDNERISSLIAHPVMC